MLNRQGNASLSPLYYDLYPGHEIRDLSFWLDLARIHSGPILELGCGTGRVMMPLIQAGYRVIGLDHDAEMLRYLRRVDKLKMNPWLICAEASAIPLEWTFNLVIVPCNTYATFQEKERLQLLPQVFCCLRPNGLFAISLPNQ